jgi:hypothetical protein
MAADDRFGEGDAVIPRVRASGGLPATRVFDIDNWLRVLFTGRVEWRPRTSNALSHAA